MGDLGWGLSLVLFPRVGDPGGCPGVGNGVGDPGWLSWGG